MRCSFSDRSDPTNHLQTNRALDYRDLIWVNEAKSHSIGLSKFISFGMLACLLLTSTRPQTHMTTRYLNPSYFVYFVGQQTFRILLRCLVWLMNRACKILSVSNGCNVLLVLWKIRFSCDMQKIRL